MALVGPERLLPTPGGYDPRLIQRASEEGRVRGIGLALLQEIDADPLKADPILRRGMREARALHSQERRFVADTLYALLRHRRVLGADPVHAWDAWLAVQRGEPVSATLPENPVEVLQFLGNISRTFATELLASVADPVAFLAASNDRAPLCIRVNRLKTTTERLLSTLGTQGVEIHPSTRCDDALFVGRNFNLVASPEWKSGQFEVQDEGSQLVGREVPLGSTVVDYCAGAGGKTLQLASRMENAGRLFAFDVRQRALEELSERAHRAGVKNLTVHLLGSGAIPLSKSSCDVVFVDAPCSGSGTLRRHPELRLRIDEDHLQEMTGLQLNILKRAQTLVKPGGHLAYATCSVLKRENEHVIASFLEDSPEWSLEGAQRWSPEVDGTDGFFLAKLRKTS